MNEFQKQVAELTFGPTKDNCCVLCKSNKTSRDDFRDNLSWKEFSMSQLCQKCQDDVFGED